MSARYELRTKGVYDRETARLILRGEAGWTDYEAWLHAGNACDPEPPLEMPPIEARRHEAAARVNGLRSHALRRATVIVGRDEFDADPATAARLALLLATAPRGAVRWRTADNRMVDLDRSALEQLAAAIAVAVDEIFARSFALKDQVIAMSPAPEAIDLETKWRSR
jgi:hypothetical protein